VVGAAEAGRARGDDGGKPLGVHAGTGAVRALRASAASSAA
jgi:hypothetical protein